MQLPSLCLEKNLGARYTARGFPPRENHLRLLVMTPFLMPTDLKRRGSRSSRAAIDRSISRRVISRDGGIPLLGISGEILLNFVPRHSEIRRFETRWGAFGTRYRSQIDLRSQACSRKDISRRICLFQSRAHTHSHTHAFSKVRGASGGFVVRISFLEKRNLLPLAVAEQSVR